jgi:Family of unknown function (DUF5309)
MAGTVVQGNVSTEEVLSDERVIDMDDKIRLLDPDDTQFVTMTSRETSRQAVREKVNWLEEEDFPRIVTAAASALIGDTAITLTAGQGKIVAANDLLRNMRTGEGIRVASVATDTITVGRNVGQVPAAAVNSGDAFLVVADAQPQGSDFPTPRYLARVLGFNYTEITRTTWGFTGTQTAIELYGGREPAKEARRKAREHKRKWEAIGFFGARSFIAAAPPENEPRGTAGGALEFITTNKVDANGPLTPTFFDNLLMTVMSHGSNDKVFFAAPLLVLSMSQWNRSGMGSQWEPNPQNVHGVKVDAFISGAYGYRVPVIVKKEWAGFPTANKGFGGYGFLLDMSYIERRPLRDRDTKLLTDEQPKGKDTYNAEYMTEATFEFAQERAHGIVYGVTAPP